MTGIPRLIAFKSPDTGKYLRSNPDLGETHGVLSFSGTDILTPFTRFELQPAAYQPLSGTNLVNIRCCYNNKYWTRGFNSDYITCGADQPDTDPSKTPSTLFQVELDKYAQPKTVNISQYRNAQTIVELINYRSEIIDLDELVVLPRFVTFKGDNDRFLRIQTYNGYDHLVFSGTNISDQSVAYEVVPNPDGTIRIKSIQTGKFWHANSSDGFILACEDGAETSDKSLWFEPKRVANSTIALYSIGSNKFCKRFTKDARRIENTLCANVSSITGEAKVKALELVRSREIYNIRFHEKEARFYDKRKMTMVSKQIVNKSEDNMTTKVILQAEKKHVANWSTSTSLKTGVSTNISTSASIAKVWEGKFEVELNVESLKGYQMGDSKETLERLWLEDHVTVRPGKKAIVSMVGTRAYINVPFTYSQRDELLDGETKIYDNMQDGIYTCVDTFNVQTVVDVKHLDEKDLKE